MSDPGSDIASSHSRSSKSPSEVDMLVIKSSAAAEVAKVELTYSEKEAELLQQQATFQAQMDARLKILRQEKELAKASTEARALRSAANAQSDFPMPILLPVELPVDRARSFVIDHAVPAAQPNEVIDQAAPAVSLKQEMKLQVDDRPQSLCLDEFARHLLRKDLLSCRLSTFDDRPETFRSWRASFQSVVTELRATYVEEIDLLIRYLGPDSSRYAKSIRSANINDPERGCARIWLRLQERFGSPESLEAALQSRIRNFPKLNAKDSKRLYNFTDLLSEIQCIKSDHSLGIILSHLDSSMGLQPLLQKLPHDIQNKWITHAFKYKEAHNTTYPPYSIFVNFIESICRLKNDPSFSHQESIPATPNSNVRRQSINAHHISANKTDIPVNNSNPNLDSCPIHHTKHSLNQCRHFKLRPHDERIEYLMREGICFKCCRERHAPRDCTNTVRCSDCGSEKHPTALHIRKPKPTERPPLQSTGEPSNVSSHCTQICGESFDGKSCAKTVLVNVFPMNAPESSIKVYAVIDDQSNATLAHPRLFDRLNVACELVPYVLNSCGGTANIFGRKTSDLVVESLDHDCRFHLPNVMECDNIPNLRHEIPTPDVAAHHPHLSDIVDLIHPLDDNAEIYLLIGRDVIEAHHILDQKIGPGSSPYAQRLKLGWVIIGETCLGKVHRPASINTFKTFIINNGRPSIFQSCPNAFDLKRSFHSINEEPNESSLFKVTSSDDCPALSIEDHQFLHIMNSSMKKNHQGNWSVPLPLKSMRQHLPNNREFALKRAQSLDRNLNKDPKKQRLMLDFMQNIFDNQHAELAPPLEENEESWYLPLFGVHNPKKPDRIRIVFDSSAPYHGVSLNDLLLQGPDLINSLLGILLRFRRETVAVMVDIRQMFHCFCVDPDTRNLLKFFWYANNDPCQPLVEYRMTVHVFGNKASPAVANYGLRRAASEASSEFGNDVYDFVKDNFYVDDGLTSQTSAEKAISLVERTRQALAKNGNIRLHKIISNNLDVMKAFDATDLPHDLKDIVASKEVFPMQRCLGISWDLNIDAFTFQVSSQDKPYTKRGLVSVINSLYDPLGFAVPVLIKGKMILRELTENVPWDEPLLPTRHEEWTQWRQSLQSLESLHIPRVFTNASFQSVEHKELHIYSDASEKAVAAVAYLKLSSSDGNVHTGFVMGKSKLAPIQRHTIPRLELCAAVLATDLARIIITSLHLASHSVRYHTDSKIVLGYVTNQSRRFSVYVANRVQLIRRMSDPIQWFYVPSNVNPADCATRSVPATDLGSSLWLRGPSLEQLCYSSSVRHFPLSDTDAELKPEATVLSTRTNVYRHMFGTHRFTHFSSWKSLVSALARLKIFAQTKQFPSGPVPTDAFSQTEQFIIRHVQNELYSEEVKSLVQNTRLPNDSPILNLNPILDEHGLIRVGGRLNYSNFDRQTTNPIIIPGKHHVATLLVRHHHELVKHQGRQFTDGSIRSAGLWITGVKRLVSSMIYSCVTCRKMRGKNKPQLMADLPADRLDPAPPFTYVGVDTFGPWLVVTRKTRGGQAQSKRWAILFTCLVVRAVHIEIVETLSSSAFINALRRFVSIRGNVIEFRSDKGTNFVGSTQAMNFNVVNVEDYPFKNFLLDNRAKWIFNPPHAPHTGGVWERMIGTVKRILNSMLNDISARSLTHDVLVTFMAEVSAIVNARPIVPVSNDPENPDILSPAAILTRKTNHQVNFGEPDPTIDPKDLFRSEWRKVQSLSDAFWKRWKTEYLHTLQQRRKWLNKPQNIQKDSVVLLSDKNLHRNEWPLGIVTSTIPSQDGIVRKVTVRVYKDGKSTICTRHISNIVLLISG